MGCSKELMKYFLNLKSIIEDEPHMLTTYECVYNMLEFDLEPMWLNNQDLGK